LVKIPGLAKFPLLIDREGGSMSREDRNDVVSRSVLVLVIVRKETRTLFCSAFEVPLRSSTWKAS
jgi:mannitol-specific phosphotransferase system IIBC component